MMPVFASFEPSNFCNLQCPQCPVSMRTKQNFKGELMSFDLFKNIFNELKHNLLYAIFYFQGEPLINKNLTKMIAFAHKNKVFTMTSTNAQLLDNQTSRELVESGLDKIIISIDGATQESYEQYRIGGSLERAIEGVKFIQNWKKKLHSRTPLVEIQCLLLSTTEQQIFEMQQLTKTLNADKLIFKTAQFYDFENGNILMPKNEKLSRYCLNTDGKYMIKNKLHNRCLRLWAGTVITSDGKILPCCFDKNADFIFGEIGENSKVGFKEIFNGNIAHTFRKKIAENRKQFAMCRNCTE
ncbi:MAG: radical SAM protein [Paludibacter sp.]|nr:radical SAM protein [Paludibacter sp.]